MCDKIMTINNITKQFPVFGGKILTACKDINLTINTGETLGIVGESGCGKSTLAKIIMHMIEPTTGEVLFKDLDITKLRGEQKRENHKHIQMIFQDPTSAFNPRMKIKDIVCEPLLNYGLISKKECLNKAIELLKLVDLPSDFAERYPHNMSGGQRQRVAIARSLALNPEIIICDEATSALDVTVQANIINLLVKLQKEKGITYIFICHDLALVHLFCHRIVVMYLGSIVEIINAKDLEKAKHPYTKALLKSVFTVNESSKQNIQVLEGDVPSPLDIPTGCSFQNRCIECKSICKHELPLLKIVDKEHQVACHCV